jgi:hypothetical protein
MTEMRPSARVCKRYYPFFPAGSREQPSALSNQRSASTATDPTGELRVTRRENHAFQGMGTGLPKAMGKKLNAEC